MFRPSVLAMGRDPHLEPLPYRRCRRRHRLLPLRLRFLRPSRLHPSDCPRRRLLRQLYRLDRSIRKRRRDDKRYDEHRQWRRTCPPRAGARGLYRPGRHRITSESWTFFIVPRNMSIGRMQPDEIDRLAGRIVRSILFDLRAKATGPSVYGLTPRRGAYRCWIEPEKSSHADVWELPGFGPMIDPRSADLQVLGHVVPRYEEWRRHRSQRGIEDDQRRAINGSATRRDSTYRSLLI